MTVVTTIIVIALFLTYLESKDKMKNGMVWGFVLVTILGCIHYDYGNDYMGYYQIFQEVVASDNSIKDVFQNRSGIYGDTGWHFLCYIFQFLGGFFMMVAVLNIIMNVLYYKFIKNNVRSDWRVLAFAIYLLSTNLYLMNFSMMRQSLVISIFLGIWPWIRDRKWYYSLPVIFFCTFIHSSAYILLPFLLWTYIPIKNTKLWVLAFVLLYIVFMMNREFMNTALSFFMRQYALSDYSYYVEHSEDGGPISYGAGFVLNTLPVIVSLAYLFNKADANVSDKYIVSLALISTLIEPFGQVAALSGRVGDYFAAYKIASIPIVYSIIENKLLRLSLLSIFLFMLVYGYVTFFQSEVWNQSYSTFHTIFSVL